MDGTDDQLTEALIQAAARRAIAGQKPEPGLREALFRLATERPALRAALSPMFADDASYQAVMDAAKKENEATRAREAAQGVEQQRRDDAARKQAAVRELEQMVGPLYAEKLSSLDAYRTPFDAQKPVLERMRRIEGRIGEFIARRCNMLLYGSAGTGKNHLMTALLYAAVRTGHSVLSVNAQRLNSMFRDGIAAEARESKLLDWLAKPTVLALSDPLPPKGVPSTWNLGNLYLLVEERTNQCRPTWVTLNAETEKEAEDALSGAVWSRLCRKPAVVQPCFWPDYRRLDIGGEMEW